MPSVGSMGGGRRPLFSVHWSSRHQPNWPGFSSPVCLSAFRGYPRCFSSATATTTPPTPAVADSSDKDDHDNNKNNVLHRHRRRRVVTVYNELHRGCLSYKQTWAWQQVLLQQRLVEAAAAAAAATTAAKSTSQCQEEKQQEEEQNSDENRIHNDCVLIVEHEPVYTLGRGADENHLAFLEEEGDDRHDGSVEKIRIQLSRKSRGPGSARLCLDRHIEEGLKRKLQQQHIENIKKV